MGRTNISWATHVWNITAGCAKVSEGCQNCWAEQMAMRLKRMGRPEYQEVVDDLGWTCKVVCLPGRLEERFPVGARVFVDSMSDLFHLDVPVDFIIDAFERMTFRKDVIWVVLTKRPERMVDVLFGQEGGWYLGGGDYIPNIWLGVTVESQAHVARAAFLLRHWTGVSFVSAEPLLGPLVLREHMVNNSLHNKLSWIIAGAESGPNRRPFEHVWAEDLHKQCAQAGTSFFGKQDSGLRLGKPLLIDGREIKEWPR